MKIKVAAIQMCAALADVSVNLHKAENLIKEAALQGAKLIVLPEFFTSACAFHPDMKKAILPIEGEGTQLLKSLSKKYGVNIGGSFISSYGSNNFNSFVLAKPNEDIGIHNKDIPTMWESCYYIGGNDDGVLQTELGPIGVALCWEMLRAQTAKRLLNKVQLVVSGSCWWNLPDSASSKFDPIRRKSLELLREAPVTFAKLLGVPIIHAGHAGDFIGFAAPSEKKHYISHYLGESVIVDAQGHVLSHMTREDGEGIIYADITIKLECKPSMTMPDSYWIPNMPDVFLEEWEKLNKFGAQYYEAYMR